MARTATQTTAPAELMEVAPAAHQELAELQSAATTHAVQASQALKTIGYDLPYDRERVVQEARFYMAQSAEAMLEAGRRLLVLKENEPHGEFEEVVRVQLGIPNRTAQRMMQSTAKFLFNPNLQAKAPALALLGKTKLFELLSEDDDDLAILADGGTLAGKTLDEFDSMTTREMKAALREAKAEAAAKDQLLEDKNKRIDKLHAQQQRIQTAPPDEVLADLKCEATAIATEAEGVLIGQVRQALLALRDHSNHHGDELGIQAVFMAGLLGQVQAQLNALREEFGLPDASNAQDQRLAAEMAEWDKA